jgi:Fic family protein
MRTYEKTHSWIKFTADLSRAHPKLWVMLGECQSKCEHLSKAPLRPETARELHQIYLAKGVQATTAIEGNTLTEEQVLQHIQGKLTLPPSTEYLQQEIDNIVQACKETIDHVIDGTVPKLSVERIKYLNASVLKKLKGNDEVEPGQLRTYSVLVGNVYRGAPAEDCEYLVDRLCDWLNGDDFLPPDTMGSYEMVFAILRAIVAHLYLAWIHPFGDGNGRTARLVEFEILNAAGLPSPVTNLLSNHYNLTRSEYYRQLDVASKSNGDVIPFILYAVQGFLDGLRGYVERVWQQHYDVVWRSYVHERFRNHSGEVHKRRRSLVLDLSRTGEAKTKSEIAILSPELAKTYARKTDKTLGRDLNELVKMGLLIKKDEHYHARTDVILGYLPVRAGNKS